MSRAALDPMLPPMPAPASRAALDPMLPPLPVHPAGSGSQVNLASASPSKALLPHSKPEDIHVQVEAPFVFRRPDPAPAGALVQSAREVTPRPADPSAAKLDPTAPLPSAPPPPKPADPVPSEPKKAERRGFFGRVKGFFSTVFR